MACRCTANDRHRAHLAAEPRRTDAQVRQQMLAAVVDYHLSKVTLIHAVPESLHEVLVISASLTVGRALIMLGAVLVVGMGSL